MRGAGGGPKTPEGKAASSRNALKHGIMSPHPVIIEEMETEADWAGHLAGFVTSCAPEGKLEEELVDRLAFIFWRLRRLKDYETAQLNYQVHTTERNLANSEAIAEAHATGKVQTGEGREIDPRKVAAYQHLQTVPAGSTLDSVIRYETHLHR